VVKWSISLVISTIINIYNNERCSQSCIWKCASYWCSNKIPIYHKKRIDVMTKSAQTVIGSTITERHATKHIPKARLQLTSSKHVWLSTDWKLWELELGNLQRNTTSHTFLVQKTHQWKKKKTKELHSQEKYSVMKIEDNSTHEWFPLILTRFATSEPRKYSAREYVQSSPLNHNTKRNVNTPT
jgi:hypothetical protein